jgi:hypothetical protein
MSGHDDKHGKAFHTDANLKRQEKAGFLFVGRLAPQTRIAGNKEKNPAVSSSFGLFCVKRFSRT